MFSQFFTVEKKVLETEMLKIITNINRIKKLTSYNLITSNDLEELSKVNNNEKPA